MPEGFENMSDNELMAVIKSGNLDAFNELSRRFDWLVRLKAGSYMDISATEQEDLMQEGYLGLFFAAKSYKDSLGASFKSYAGICISNRMVSAYRKYQAKKSMVLTDSLNFEEDSSLIYHEETPERIYEIKENIDDINKQIASCLSTFELKVLTYYLSGIKRTDVELKTGIALKSYDNAINRIRRKLRSDISFG